MSSMPRLSQDRQGMPAVTAVGCAREVLALGVYLRQMHYAPAAAEHTSAA
jgi:hypothetical protein